MASNLPLTVEAALVTNFNYAICYGGNQVAAPSSPAANTYWYVVFDRSSLAVVFNQFSTDNANVPSGLSTYDTDQYMLVLVTIGLGTLNVPQGALYDFLQANGGGPALQSLVQISTQLSCGEISNVAYCLVGVLGESDTGYEASKLQDIVVLPGSGVGSVGGPGPILTLTLLATTVNGQTLYTPVSLGN